MCKKVVMKEYIEEIAKLRAGMREIYEVWAGSEGLVEETASEAYQVRLIKQMRDIAADYSVLK